jgi:ATP-dependent Lon protease
MAFEHSTRLSCDQIRWTCDPATLDFETTDDVDPAVHVVGQQLAYDALLFGIQCEAPGQNVYVRGARGVGRTRMVEKLLEELKPTTSKKRDYCYVHNFSRPQSPRLIALPPGSGPMFRKIVSELTDFIEVGLRSALDSEPNSSQLTQLKEGIQNEVEGISKSLEDELTANEMTLVNVQNGPMTQTVILPLVGGEPVPPPKLKALVEAGEAPATTVH